MWSAFCCRALSWRQYILADPFHDVIIFVHCHGVSLILQHYMKDDTNMDKKISFEEFKAGDAAFVLTLFD